MKRCLLLAPIFLLLVALIEGQQLHSGYFCSGENFYVQYTNNPCISCADGGTCVRENFPLPSVQDNFIDLPYAGNYITSIPYKDANCQTIDDTSGLLLEKADCKSCSDGKFCKMEYNSTHVMYLEEYSDFRCTNMLRRFDMESPLGVCMNNRIQKVFQSTGPAKPLYQLNERCGLNQQPVVSVDRVVYPFTVNCSSECVNEKKCIGTISKYFERTDPIPITLSKSYLVSYYMQGGCQQTVPTYTNLMPMDECMVSTDPFGAILGYVKVFYNGTHGLSAGFSDSACTNQIYSASVVGELRVCVNNVYSDVYIASTPPAASISIKPIMSTKPTISTVPPKPGYSTISPTPTISAVPPKSSVSTRPASSKPSAEKSTVTKDVTSQAVSVSLGWLLSAFVVFNILF